jgi:chromate transporter
VILVLFIVPFWDDLKKVSRIKYSLSGINAVSVGFIFAAFVLLVRPIGLDLMSISIMVVTFLVLNFTRISPPVIVLAGILLGYFL